MEHRQNRDSWRFECLPHLKASDRRWANLERVRMQSELTPNLVRSAKRVNAWNVNYLYFAGVPSP